MRLIIPLYVITLVIFFHVQTATASQLTPRFSPVTSNTSQLDWFGVPGRTYFIQASVDGMQTWEYLPDIRLGQGFQLSMGFENATEHLFVRTVSVDIPTDDPDIADYDNDGYTNLEEVFYGTDPLVFNAGGPVGGGGGGAGGGNGNNDEASGPAMFELKYKVTRDGVSSTIRHRLDAGFNNASQLICELPTIPVSRSNDTVTEITLTDLTGQAGGATLNFIKVQNNIENHDPKFPLETSIVGAVPFVIPENEDPNANPPIPPAAVHTFVGDVDPALLGSGAQWILQPMDLTVVFGIEPEHDSEDDNSKIRLKNYLEDRLDVAEDDYFNLGNIWGVRGVAPRVDGQPEEEQIYGLEIFENQQPLERALQSGGRAIIFDGHSNFGLGPNFSVTPVKVISDFANFGVGYTDISRNYRGFVGNTPIQTPEQQLANGLDAADIRMQEEGWAYLVLEPGQVEGDVPNYIPAPLTVERFPDSGVAVGQNITRKGQEPDTFHYGNRVMVDSPDTEVPERLRYDTFFFNACSSGKDYIENFQRGKYVYTTETCDVLEATFAYVKHFLDGRNNSYIVNDMNQKKLGGGQGNEYNFHNFNQN